MSSKLSISDLADILEQTASMSIHEIAAKVLRHQREINKELIEALEYILDVYIEDPCYAGQDKSVQNAYRVLDKVGANNED